MKVILGLGNPGLRFRFSRHNLGFLVVEKLAKDSRIKTTQKAFGCLLGQGKIKGEQLLLARPLTFMNLSGEAAVAIVRWKKVKLADLLAICDDVNLPLGKIRLRPKGSDGGHKGLRSIIGALASRDFPRLRIGVGIPQVKADENRLRKYVLGRFNKKEIKIINETIEKAVAASIIWAKEGIAAAMNKFN